MFSELAWRADMDAASCDNLVVTGSRTPDGSVLFAKNSDRHPAECQYLRNFSATDPVEATPLRCQYRTIPQAPHTFRMLGSQPYWLWGFEHGLNEQGVAIGNEAIWMKGPVEKSGLMGMDLIRLGLERAATAHEALDVMTQLLETHGQGGSARFWDPEAPGYHNSFLIADPSTAWVLETSGRDWVAAEVHGATSISNYPTIGKEFDLASASLRDQVGADFARDFCDLQSNPHAGGKARLDRSRTLLHEHQGPFTVRDVMKILRDHGGAPGWTPADSQGHTLCMHPGSSQTVASMVVHLRDDGASRPRGLEVRGATAWCSLVTPCISPFLPFYVDVEVPEIYARGTNEPHTDSLWWRFRRLQDAVCVDWPARYPVVRREWDSFEEELLHAAPECDRLPQRVRASRVQANVRETLWRLAKLERELGIPAASPCGGVK